MDYFEYHDDELWAEGVPLAKIAQAVGTPFYVYSSATLRRHYNVFAEGFDGADVIIAFAVKALSNIAVLSLLAKEGAGADIVSGGELYRAQRAGVEPRKIVFSGVGKTKDEMATALDAGIGQFNVEGEAELRALSEVAAAKGGKAPVAFRINPDVDAQTDTRISTGRAEDKFGIPFGRTQSMFALARDLPGIYARGVAMHIGSQITSLSPFEAAARSAVGLVGELRAQGYDLETLDLGGGLGVPYAPDDTPPSPREYAALLRRITDGLGVTVMFEPGRMIAGNAGLFISKVIYLKNQGEVNYAIVDGAMNDLIRPALYGAHHTLLPVVRKKGESKPYHVAGPVCESTDVFARHSMLTAPEADDLLAFRTAGAYGAVQASEYNTRPLVPEVLVNGDQFAVIRHRPTYEHMLSLETIPTFG
ncbi:MAG: diaminopimelate decarboxylase [Pseudomonadota bacterium]